MISPVFLLFNFKKKLWKYEENVNICADEKFVIDAYLMV